MKEVVIFDYGFGNVRSAQRAFSYVGARVEITADPETALKAHGVVIPGVGSFAACMQGFRAARGEEIVRERLENSQPVFGICVGHQIMFESSTEGVAQNNALISGLGVLQGQVQQLPAETVPHIGWNAVERTPQSALFNQIDDPHFYFVHSYAVLQNAHKLGVEVADAPNFFYTEHEDCRFVAAVEYGALFGTQFHPEKSGRAGLQLIDNWVKRL
jgi:glutamine amidotransferase